jgi:hypothetical protein
MADSGGVSDLMAEVGGTLGIAETIELPERAGWYVSTSMGAALVLTYDPDADQLNFHSRLGRPEPALREATYGLLLAYNGRSKETGGGWTGLEEPGGEAVLRFAAPAAALDADTLRGLILDVLRVVGGFRDYVGRKDRSAAPDPDLLRFDIIRG